MQHKVEESAAPESSAHLAAMRALLLGAALTGIMASPMAAQPSPQSSPSGALAIAGDIPSPLTLKLEDLAKMPRQTVSVTDRDGAKLEYEGVSLLAILQRAGAPLGKDLRGKALASYVLAKARDGYQVLFTLAEVHPDFANEPILIADRRNGKPLPADQGPLRLVCANDKEGARSVRMLESLQLVRLQK